MFTIIEEDSCCKVRSLGVFADAEAVGYRLMHVLEWSQPGDTYRIEREEMTNGLDEKTRYETCLANRAKYKQEQEELEELRASKEEN